MGFLVVVVLVLAGSGVGCAVPLRVLAGNTEGSPLAVRARAAGDADGTRLTLALENRGDDPVGIDLDKLSVRAASGTTLPALGRPQKFRGQNGGEEAVRRVPNGAVVVEPHGRAQVQVEFAPLPGSGAMSLRVPALYRLGIEGQVPLAGMQVPLAPDATGGGADGKQAFYDPFEE